MASLIPDGADTFVEDLTFTTTSTAFAFNPVEFKLVGGDKDLKFAFAPKAATAAGL